MAGTLSYRDAVVLLGGDPPALVSLDRALGGLLSIATGGASDTVLSLVEAQGRILRFGRDLAAGLRDRLVGATRVDRTRVLAAAHAVLVVTAYFEALDQASLPFDPRELRLARRDQLGLATDHAGADDLLAALVTDGPPRPAPHLPYEDFLVELRAWYRGLSTRLVAFAGGLAVWEGLDDARRASAEELLGAPLVAHATSRFEQRYRQLAEQIPEFGLWTGQIEHQATRAQVRRALAGVKALLAVASSTPPPINTARALSTAYQAALPRPILTEGDAPAGLRLPTLEEGYLDPDFQVRPMAGERTPAEEGWWAGAAVRADLTEFLAGALTAPQAASAPLVVLGQPGAGKSVLTRVLAARLPASDFLPVRVVLREVPAEADVQEQIEYAVRAATGERAAWPDLVRAAPGVTPVVLLDGFDELLQATGVSQSDYLIKVARFQQREADQGRPVVAIVTSRTVVAGRARYPLGAVVLRLRPFRPRQIGDWLEVWNRLNAGYLAGRGLATLPAEVVARHGELASAPLLLLMLALYDADANALQRAGVGRAAALDEATLYEALLSSFAAREVAKSASTLPPEAVTDRVERELQRLSLAAFAMINRSRQWVTEAELDGDLAALLDRRTATATATASDFEAPLTDADITLGRFFFVQRAQAVRGGARLATFEFLHATFGEYLAARLTVQLAAGLLTQRSALAVGRSPLDDGILYALLSFAPLSSRQMLRFVRACCAHRLAPDDRRRLADLLIGLLGDSARRTEHRHAGYQPVMLAVSSRHGIYGANLVLLVLALVADVRASELFPAAPDPVGLWHRQVLHWRSSLTEPDWTELALAMSVRHTWNGAERELVVSLAEGRPVAPEPVDPYWLFHRPREQADRRASVWSRPYLDDIVHKMDVAGGTNDSVIRHALEPVLRWLGPAVMTFAGSAVGTSPASPASLTAPAASVAHVVIDLCLTAAFGSDEEVTAAYRRVLRLSAPLRGRPDGDALTDAYPLLLRQLLVDVDRLPPDLVVSCLRTWTLPRRPGVAVARRIVDAVASADLDDEARRELAGFADSIRDRPLPPAP